MHSSEFAVMLARRSRTGVSLLGSDMLIPFSWWFVGIRWRRPTPAVVYAMASISLGRQVLSKNGASGL